MAKTSVSVHQRRRLGMKLTAKLYINRERSR